MILLANVGTKPLGPNFTAERKGSHMRDAAEVNKIGWKFIDCREYRSEANCKVALSADSD
jgi:hypothetical protein